MMAKMDKEQ